MAEERDTNKIKKKKKKKTRGKPKLVPRFAAGTSNKLYASGDFTNYKRYRNQILSILIRLNKVSYYKEFFDANIN